MEGQGFLEEIQITEKRELKKRKNKSVPFFLTQSDNFTITRVKSSN